jgi:hypothetical protein
MNAKASRLLKSAKKMTPRGEAKKAMTASKANTPPRTSPSPSSFLLDGGSWNDMHNREVDG